jgi:hypothetical protein
MVYETQNMFNKQLSRLMQKIMAAEIHIKNSIEHLRSKVSVEFDAGYAAQMHGISEPKSPQSTEMTSELNRLLATLNTDNNRLVSTVIGDNDAVVKKNVITVKNIAMCLSKTNIKVNIQSKEPLQTVPIGPCTISNTQVTMLLTEQNLQLILGHMV